MGFVRAMRSGRSAGSDAAAKFSAPAWNFSACHRRHAELPFDDPASFFAMAGWSRAQALLGTPFDVKEPRMPSDTLCALPIDRDIELALETRIRAEFEAMPGLKLTLPPTCRLFSLERAQCERIMERMVMHGDLSEHDGSFSRVGEDVP
jgi:hypothetical protein